MPTSQRTKRFTFYAVVFGSLLLLGVVSFFAVAAQDGFFVVPVSVLMAMAILWTYRWCKADTALKEEQEGELAALEASQGSMASGDSLSALPPGWSEHVSEETGDLFYHNNSTGHTSWTRPTS